MRGDRHLLPARRTAAQLLRAARERRVPSQVEHLAAEGEEDGRRIWTSWKRPQFAHAPGLEREPEGAVELFAARTPRGEVEWTAARILELVRREGLPLPGHRGGSPILQDLSGFGGVGVRPVRGAGVLLPL